MDTFDCEIIPKIVFFVKFPIMKIQKSQSLFTVSISGDRWHSGTGLEAQRLPAHEASFSALELTAQNKGSLWLDDCYYADCRCIAKRQESAKSFAE